MIDSTLQGVEMARKKESAVDKRIRKFIRDLRWERLSDDDIFAIIELFEMAIEESSEKELTRMMMKSLINCIYSSRKKGGSPAPS